MIEKIISGGQTGVDTSALDVAIAFGIPFGGWCPMGRINEEGIISEIYADLKELHGYFQNDQEKYNARTQKNIEDSDGTLVIVPEYPLPDSIQDGTRLTIEYAERNKRPCICLGLSESVDMNRGRLDEWIHKYDIKILNIAGPRESSSRGIYALSYELIHTLLAEYIAQPRFLL